MKIITTRYDRFEYANGAYCFIGNEAELVFDESEEADREIRALIDHLEKALTERLRERRKQKKLYKVLPVKIGETRVPAVIVGH